MKIDLKYHCFFTYDENNEIIYVSGSVNRVLDAKTKQVLGTMGKIHHIPPKVTSDGQWIAFGHHCMVKNVIYSKGEYEKPTYLFKRGQDTINHEEEQKWLNNHQLLTNVEDQVWLIDVLNRKEECCYPSEPGKDQYVTTTDVWNGEILIGHRVFEGDTAYIQMTYLVPQKGGWQKQTMFLPNGADCLRFDRKGGMYVFLNDNICRHYPTIPDFPEAKYESLPCRHKFKVSVSDDGQYFCSAGLELGNTYKDTFYSISLYQTSPWKEIYYERSSSFISCGFSNLGNWFLVSGTSSWLMPIKEIKTGV